MTERPRRTAVEILGVNAQVVPQLPFCAARRQRRATAVLMLRRGRSTDKEANRSTESDNQLAHANDYEPGRLQRRCPKRSVGGTARAADFALLLSRGCGTLVRREARPRCRNHANVEAILRVAPGQRGRRRSAEAELGARFAVTRMRPRHTFVYSGGREGVRHWRNGLRRYASRAEAAGARGSGGSAGAHARQGQPAARAWL